MEDCKYKLSIIVPVYNVEQYIKECLDSILTSDLPKEQYEVVIVNDGSKDNSGCIAQEYVTQHANWKYIEQENQGLSVARNNGIQHSEGEYVWCVDSDDVIYSQIMPAYKLLNEEKKVDVLECRLKVFHDETDFAIHQLNGQIEYASGQDFIINGYMPGSACTKFIRKDFLYENNLWFVPGLIHQDTELSYRLYAHSQSICQFKYYIYHYRWGEESLTRTTNPQKIFNDKSSNIYIYKSFEDLADKFDKSNHTMAEIIRMNARRILLTTVYTLFSKKKEYKQIGIYDKLYKEMKTQGVYPLKGNFYSLKRNIIARLLNISFLLR